MFNSPSQERLKKIPRLYGTESIPLKEKLIYLHFFIMNTDFYICEYDREDNFWGFVILNGDLMMAEWGYINYEELKTIRVNGWQEIDCDLHWRVRPASQVEKICIAQGWTLPDHSPNIEIECPSCRQIILSGSEDDVSCLECKVVILQQRINSVDQGGFQHGIYS